MNADEVLELVRPLIVEMDDIGTVRRAHAAGGGFLGHRPSTLISRSIFDIVDPVDADALRAHFADAGGSASDPVRMPLPSRVRVTGADGRSHAVDVVTTAMQRAGDAVNWVVVLLPITLSTPASRSLDAEMAGAPRQRVKEMLTEELETEGLATGGASTGQPSTVPTTTATGSRWFMIDLLGATSAGQVDVTTSRPGDQQFARILGQAVARGDWIPWSDVPPGSAKPLTIDDLTPPVRMAAERRGWRRFVVAPVHVEGRIAAVFVRAAPMPSDPDAGDVTTSVMAGIQDLVDVTSLLLTRWRDQDRQLVSV